MARFQSELPSDLIKQLDEVEKNYKKMFGEMCEVGAAIVRRNVISNMRNVFRSTKTLEEGLLITKVYQTPSDDGINVYVGFYGYDKEGVPIPLKAQAREYGTSRGEDKKPFFRKSFNKRQIEKEMIEVQKKYIKGD